MRTMIEASKSDTLFTLDISEPVDGPDGKQCEVVYSAKPHFNSASNGRRVISHKQAELIVTAIGCILETTTK